MTIKEMVEMLSKELDERWTVYKELNEKFNDYTNRDLSEDEFKEANKTLDDIQVTFHDMYHAFNFVGLRLQQAENAIDGFNKFMKDLKDAGATEVKNIIN